MSTMSLGTISSSTGLISGIDYETLVTNLMKLASTRKTLLSNATDKLTEKKTAYTKIQANLATLQYSTNSLGKSSLFESANVTSSNASVIKLAANGSPTTGTYKFVAVQEAQAGQVQSGSYSSSTSTVGSGTLTFRFGDTVAKTASLSSLNGGVGITKGSIRITDRSGASADVDLSNVQTLNDVLTAINNNTTIDVTAAIEGDHITLTDNTGETKSNLIVKDIKSGSTASSLGLAGINVATSTADGSDLISLSKNTSLSDLNDGMGVAVNTALADFSYTLRDGTTGTIDLSPATTTGSGNSAVTTVDADTTLGDVVDRINAANSSKLSASISSDGKRIVITDLTSGSGDFKLTELSGSTVLQDLGLNKTSEEGVITGDRIIGGANSVLLSSLNGGAGLGDLGQLKITNRSGEKATVDLSGAETLDDVASLINNAGLGVSASINDPGTGLKITDTTGTDARNLIIADGDDGLKTATALGITANVAANSVTGGDLKLQVVGVSTNLSSLNGGAGVAKSSFSITDSKGSKTTIDLSGNAVSTIGDVINLINLKATGVTASINSTGDGIQLVDKAGGSSTLSVKEGSGTTAEDLHLTGFPTTKTVNGTSTQVIDGAVTQSVTIDSTDTLDALVTKINKLGAGVTASVNNDGGGYRLVLESDNTGAASKLVVNSTGSGLSFSTLVDAQDAILKYSVSGASSMKTVTSSSNTFSGVVEGLDVTIASASTSAVTGTVTEDYSNLQTAVKSFVSYYNSYLDTMSGYTTYNSTTTGTANATDLLLGDSTAFLIESRLSNLVSGRFTNTQGDLQGLANVGISFDQSTGQLTFDSTVLESALDSNSSAVENFFTNSITGFSAKFSDMIDSLSESDSSLISTKISGLEDTVSTNTAKMTAMQKSLDAQETRLYTQMYHLETTISSLQKNLKALDSISWITDSKSSSSS